MPDDPRVAEIIGRIQEGIRYRNKFRQNSSIYWSLYYARHWPDPGIGERDVSRPVLNYAKSVVETRLAHLTASRPRIVYLPREPNDTDLARIHTAFLDHWSDRIHLPRLWTLAEKEGYITGTGILYVGGVDGRRRPIVKVVDPTRFVVQPGVTSLDEADWAAQIDLMTREQAERFFLADGDQASARAAKTSNLVWARDFESFVDSFSVQGSDFSVFTLSGPGIVNPATRSIVSADRRAQEVQYRIVVIHYWSRTPEGNLRMTRLVGNEITLEQDLPFGPNSNSFPYVLFSPYPDSKSIWPNGIMADVANMQASINKREQTVLEILRLTASPIFLLPSESGIKERNIVARPGMVLRYNHPFRPDWLVPDMSPIGPLLNTQQLDMARLNDILGQTDVLRGSLPPNVEAGVAINRLAALASARIQLEAGFLADSLRRLGELLLQRMSHYVTEEETIRVVGEGETRFVRANAGPASSRIGGSAFDVRVEFSTSIEEERERQFQKLLILYQAGLVDDETLLAHSGLSNWKEIIRKRRAAQAEMAGAMISPPPAPLPNAPGI